MSEFLAAEITRTSRIRLDRGLQFASVYELYVYLYHGMETTNPTWSLPKSTRVGLALRSALITLLSTSRQARQRVRATFGLSHARHAPPELEGFSDGEAKSLLLQYWDTYSAYLVQVCVRQTELHYDS